MFEKFFNFMFIKEDKPQQKSELKIYISEKTDVMSLFNNLKGFNVKERQEFNKTSEYA